MTWGETFRRPAQAPDDRPWREPVRVALLGAGAVLVVGAPLPWLSATLPFHGDVSTNGFDLPGDGAITFSIGLALIAFGWFPSATASRIAPVVLAPLLMGLATLSLTLTGYQLNEAAARQIANGGGEASDGIGLAITGLGGVAATLIGALHIVRKGRSVDYRPRVSGSTLVRIAGGIVGAFGSVIAVIAMTPSGGAQPNVGGVTFLVMFAGLFGAYAGAAIAGFVFRGLRHLIRSAGT